MKKSVLFLAFVALFSLACDNAQNNQPATEQKAAEVPKTEVAPNTTNNTSDTAKATDTATSSEDVVKRGAALSSTETVRAAQVMENPKSFEGKNLTVEGKIARVCQEKGCWMELTEKEGDPGMRITFKDYAFFVPTDSQGKKVKAEGKLELKVMPKEQVEHLVGEGSKLKVNPDGTANTVSLVASGVEVYSTK
jgi:hypothetical protein